LKQKKKSWFSPFLKTLRLPNDGHIRHEITFLSETKAQVSEIEK